MDVNVMLGEKRSDQVMPLAMIFEKTPHPGIPPSFPVSPGRLFTPRDAHERAAARSSPWS